VLKLEYSNLKKIAIPEHQKDQLQTNL